MVVGDGIVNTGISPVPSINIPLLIYETFGKPIITWEPKVFLLQEPSVFITVTEGFFI
jgi:hypothetical protein